MPSSPARAASLDAASAVSTASLSPIRTFKPRRGRVTPRQASALERLWPAFGVDLDDLPAGPIDPESLFDRVAPLVLEIGFGMGETTAAMAEADPGRDVLAVDVHTPGAGALLHECETRGLANVRVVLGDGVELLRERVAAGSLDEVRIFFPDPWPKARHHKRRLLQPGFAALVASRLRVGGRLHVATDWEPYAEQVLDVVRGEPLLLPTPDGFAERPEHRPVTRFERQGLAKGHRVHDVVAVRVAA
ncbi:MAG: tRNA (guanosine(46)-N7)-methyltransferase TrmB [Motilibacteraceae bacterium]